MTLAHEQIQHLLAGFQPDAASKHPAAVQKALFVARRLQERASELQTPSERRQQAELDRMLQVPTDKSTLAQMTDQSFRAQDPHRAVDHLVHILDVQGIPRFFNPLERTLLKGFQSFGGYAPGVALPLVKEHMQKETANVILPGEKAMLTQHLHARTQEGVRMNVNCLGEAILGEEDAEKRLQEYLQALQWPEVEVVSIKISTLYSQISALAREHTVATLCDRLERLFRTAAHMTFTRSDGTKVSKFVYLDMEEYRDKELTAEAFMRTLERPGMEPVRAGIALQSYVPDTFPTLLQIQEWARQRVARAGGRITIRLVKGANMEMERAEASIRGWPQSPYKTKVETDANFRRMVHAVMQPENFAAMDVGIASHNLFELAYSLVLAAERDALDRVQFEMLEGMANHQRRALFELSNNVLLYAPACKKENFINAIGYLIRRLDENTGPDNFLRHAFKIKVGSPEWEHLEKGFLAAFDALPTLSAAPRRTQNRQLPPPSQSPAVARGWQHFVNEPDTDFALPQNGEWAQQIIAKWQPLCEVSGTGVSPVRSGSHGRDARATTIPLVVAGEEVLEARAVRECWDPSRPGVVVGRYRQATDADINRAVDCAAADPDGWRSLSATERWKLLGRVAQELRIARGHLMGAALADGGKTLPESDPEVSEAVDFLEFYRDTARWWQEMPTLKARPKGVVVVVPPWNFPIAIPCGGVAAALAAGNTVIIKPASDTVLVAWEFCQCFWRAGVSKRALQFLPCSGGKEGRKLVNHPKVNAVVLTGGTDTALTMLGDNPRLSLFAETGGKDATIVTALSDRDQAIKHVLHSAFSHGGQKCSATSLLLLEAEVYDDPHFRKTFCDAITSMKVGSAWDLDTKMGPLIRPPGGDLETALKVLEPGEEWAMMPRPLDGNPNLWSPGVKYGVQPGSYTHLTEFFGPVLGVMRFTKLSEAVALVNQTGFGLTSGLESLDEREWEYWREHIRAGNLYINRVTTGAIVLRQPFGGFGKSAFGPGMKAGGPNYVAQFMDFTDAAPSPRSEEPERPDLKELCRALRNCGGRQQSSTQFPGAAERSSLSPAEGERTGVRGEGGAATNQLHDQHLRQTPHPDPLPFRRGEGSNRETVAFASASAPGGISEHEIERIMTAIASCERNHRDEFSPSHDHFQLVGQDNFRRYLALRDVRIRVHPDDTAFDLFVRVCAAHLVGSQITVSAPPNLELPALKLLESLTESWAGAIEFVEETDAQLAQAITNRQADRVRYAAPERVPLEALRASATAGLCVVSVPVVSEGRLELLWYVQEQSLSIDYHRYGNLGPRVNEARTEPL